MRRRWPCSLQISRDNQLLDTHDLFFVYDVRSEDQLWWTAPKCCSGTHLVLIIRISEGITISSEVVVPPVLGRATVRGLQSLQSRDREGKVALEEGKKR